MLSGFRAETPLDLASVCQLNLPSAVRPMITPDSFQLLRAKTLARLQEIGLKSVSSTLVDYFSCLSQSTRHGTYISPAERKATG
jgi:hypothetical protein